MTSCPNSSTSHSVDEIAFNSATSPPAGAGIGIHPPIRTDRRPPARKDRDRVPCSVAWVRLACRNLAARTSANDRFPRVRFAKPNEAPNRPLRVRSTPTADASRQYDPLTRARAKSSRVNVAPSRCMFDNTALRSFTHHASLYLADLLSRRSHQSGRPRSGSIL